MNELNVTGLIAGTAARSLLILVPALIAARMARRASAAARHLIWNTAIAALLLMPILTVGLPRWTLPIPVAKPAVHAVVKPAVRAAATPAVRATSTPARGRPGSSGFNAPSALRRALVTDPREISGVDAPAMGGPSSIAPRRHFDIRTTLPAIWLAGFLVVLSLMIVEIARIRMLTRGAATISGDPRADRAARMAARLNIRRRVRLLEGNDTAMPMTWGVWTPTILLPRASREWSPDRLAAVLNHELAHVRRGDYGTQLMAEIVTALYWFNPFAWYAANRLHAEREHACDDEVVNGGAAAFDYAGELLDLARSLRTPALTSRAALSMARTSQLAERLKAILDERRPRRGFSRRSSVLVMILTAAFCLGLASVSPAWVARRPQRHPAPPQFPAIPSIPAYPSMMAPPAIPTPTPMPSMVAPAPMPPPRALFGPSIPPLLPSMPPLPAVPSTLSLMTAMPAMPLIPDVPLMSEMPPMPAMPAMPPIPAMPDGGLFARGFLNDDENWADGDWQGRWRAERDGDKVWFELRFRSKNSNWAESQDIQLDDFRSMTVKTADGFEIRRDAGTFVCTGAFDASDDDAIGKGSMTFRGNPDYIAEMKRRGYAVEESDLMSLAVQDISFAFIDELKAAGYDDLPLDRLVEFRIHGVSGRYVRDMKSAGLRDLTAERLVEMRIHGVTPEFVGEMRDMGLKSVDPEDFVAMRIHGVSAEFAGDMARLGLDDLTLQTLLDMRIHGVTPEFVEDLRDAGLKNLSAERLLELRIQGITPEYIADVMEMGYDRVTLDELLQMRIHGVTPEYIHDLSELGYRHVPLEKLVEMRIHGVTPEFIREVHEAGYDNVTVDDLIDMRIHNSYRGRRQ